MFKLKKNSRINYWSCSKFADLIRGTSKPFALSSDGWDEWNKKAKKKHPYRYWIAEELLDRLQDIIHFPRDIYHTIEVYVRNRFIDKIHYLHTGLIPGEYYDLDHRILHGLFNELVYFVECEQAHLMKAYKERDYKFIKGRCAQAGLDYLEWASNIKLDENYGFTPEDKEYGKLTNQAKNSLKIIKLYTWWKNRSNRPDPYKLFTKERDGSKYFIKIDELENTYNKEDTKMLIKLIKIRDSLWT